MRLPRSLEHRFELGQELGSGNFGAVHLVRDRSTGTCLALKQILLQGDGARERREIEANLRLQHPHVIRCFEGGIEGDQAYLLMERAEGSLEDWIDDPGQLSRSWTGLLQAARGVAAVHRIGLVHRDLKPANLLSVGGVVKVSDLGLAKGSDLETVTETGVILGTPDYMCPEQVRCEGVHPAWDVFALGVIAYQLLEGHLPVPEGSLIERLHALQRGQLLPWRRAATLLDPRSEELVRALLEVDPSRRPSDLEGWADQLAGRPPPGSREPRNPGDRRAPEAAVSPTELPVTAPRPRPGRAPEPPGKVRSTGSVWRRRLPFLASGLALVLLALLVGELTPGPGRLPGPAGPETIHQGPPPETFPDGSPTGRARLGDRIHELIRSLEEDRTLAEVLSPREEGRGGLPAPGDLREALAAILRQHHCEALLARLGALTPDQDLARLAGALALRLRLLVGVGAGEEGAPSGAADPGSSIESLADTLERWLLDGAAPGPPTTRGRWVSRVPEEYGTRKPRPGGPTWLAGTGLQGALPGGRAGRELEFVLSPPGNGDLILRLSRPPGGPPWVPVIEVVGWSGVLELPLAHPGAGSPELWSLEIPRAILPRGTRALRLRLQGPPGIPPPQPLASPRLELWVTPGVSAKVPVPPWEAFFPADYVDRARGEIRRAATWIRDARGRPDRLRSSGELFLDSDFSWWALQIQNLPELARFYRWLARGGVPAEVGGERLEGLARLDELYASEGMPRPFGSFLGPSEDMFLPLEDGRVGWEAVASRAYAHVVECREERREQIRAWDDPIQPFPFALEAGDMLLLRSHNPTPRQFPWMLKHCVVAPGSRRSVAAWTYAEQEALVAFLWAMRRARQTPGVFDWDASRRLWERWRILWSNRVGSAAYFPPEVFLPPEPKSAQASLFAWMVRSFAYQGRILAPAGPRGLEAPREHELSRWLPRLTEPGEAAPDWDAGHLLLAEVLLWWYCEQDRVEEAMELLPSFLPQLGRLRLDVQEEVVEDLARLFLRCEEKAMLRRAHWEELWEDLVDRAAAYESSCRERVEAVSRALEIYRTREE